MTPVFTPLLVPPMNISRYMKNFTHSIFQILHVEGHIMVDEVITKLFYNIRRIFHAACCSFVKDRFFDAVFVYPARTRDR